jgi:predicted ABC-type transport system involved in lysophospholipase L1 biosynthesis ATPase subunit
VEHDRAGPRGASQAFVFQTENLIGQVRAVYSVDFSIERANKTSSKREVMASFSKVWNK